MNDAPVATGIATLAAIDEDAASPPGATVSVLFAGNFSDAADQVLGGSSANSFAGIAISNQTVDASKGAWQYSTDGGGSWTPLAGATTTAAITLNAADLLRFVPAANYNGAATALSANLIESGQGITSGATLDLTAVDTGGTTHISSAAVALSETINAVNDAPSGTDKTVTTSEDTAYTFTVGDFGFSDVGGNALQAVKIATLSGAGTLTNNGVALSAGQSVSAADVNAGLLKFAPAANASGASYASFTFQVQDDGGTANGGVDLDPTANTITVDVTPVNDAPVVAHAIADQLATQGNPFSLQFAANTFSDVDGDPLLYTAALNSGPLPAWLHFDGNTRTFSGTPTNADVGTIVVQVTASDGTLSVSDTFNIAVGNTNDAPVIQGVGGTVTVAEDNPVLLQAQPAQVTDADGDTLTMTLGVNGGRLAPSQAILDAIASHALTSSDSDGTDGTLSVTGSAAAITAAIQAGITYTPNANVNGLDALDVAITDGQATATASVAINITPVNDAPVTSPVTLASIAEDSGPRLITQAQLLVNASDVDGPSPLTAINLQISAGSGSLDDNGNGTWTYHPALNDSSSVSFSYSVTDGVAAVATTASLDITPVNDAPVTAPVTLAAIAEDSGPRLITQAELLVSASDVDGPSPLTAINLQVSAGSGSLDDNGNGTWTYHPALNDDTSVTFSYAVTDGIATVATTASLDITPVNDVPVTSPVTLVAIVEDSGPRLITQAELLTNASDVDGPSPLTAINLQISAGNGALDDNGNGTWTYHPALNDNTSVTFSYSVTDGVTPVTTSASLDIIDTAAPAAVATVTGLSADTGTVGDFITSVASQTVSGSYTGTLLAGEKIQVSTDGNIWIDATAASGAWSASGVTLAAGTGTLSVRTIDAANNTTAGTGHSYTLDQTAPVAAVAITAIATDTGTAGDFITSDTTLVVSGTNGALGASERVQISSDGSNWFDVTQTTGTTWSYDDAGNPHLSNVTYQVRVIDAAANVGSTASQLVIIDTATPAAGTLSFANLTDTGTPNTPPVTQDNAFGLALAGQETAAGTTTVYQVSVNGGGFANTTASQSALADGSYQFRAVTTDAAGNASTSNIIAVVVDTAAPAAVATVTGLSADTGTVGDFITSVASQTVSGSYTGTLLAGEKIQVSTDGNIWIDATAAVGTWSASGVTLAAGTGALSVRTIDAADNTTPGTALRAPGIVIR